MQFANDRRKSIPSPQPVASPFREQHQVGSRRNPAAQSLATERITQTDSSSPVAGPPGSGKSTLADRLAQVLNAESARTAIVVPLDGFHFDNAVLEQRHLIAQKGAPETFDVDGFSAVLDRLRKPAADVAIPIFDRARDLSRAAADIVTTAHIVF